MSAGRRKASDEPDLFAGGAGGGVAGSGGDGPEVWSVAALVGAVRTTLEGRFPSLWVAGEIVGYSRAASGHHYFSLKDASGQIDCTFFRSAAASLAFELRSGMEVRVQGGVTVYEAGGRLQLNVRRLEPVSDEGIMRAAFEQLRARLVAEGVTAAERKRPIPRHPVTVGVVTSTGGAALRDILNVISRRAPFTRVLVMNTRVQGAGAAEEIARAIRTLGDSGRIDSLIVARGGGSLQDLWAFNEEVVARAVLACPVPVIAGVGHETDTTIVDFVADARTPTPTAAAQRAVPDGPALLEAVERAATRLATALRRRAQLRHEQVTQGRPRLSAALRSLLQRRRAQVDVRQRLVLAIRRRLGAERATVGALAGRLDALSPLGTLERGYSVARTPAGRVLRGVDDFGAGDEFELRVVDGRVACHVDRVVERDAPRPGRGAPHASPEPVEPA